MTTGTKKKTAKPKPAENTNTPPAATNAQQAEDMIANMSMEELQAAAKAQGMEIPTGTAEETA